MVNLKMAKKHAEAAFTKLREAISAHAGSKTPLTMDAIGHLKKAGLDAIADQLRTGQINHADAMRNIRHVFK